MSLNYHRTLPEVLDIAFKTFSESPAFSCMGQSLSFAEVDRLSAKFASFLQTQTSLKVGDRIAVQLPNVLQYPVVVYGALRAGLIVVNTNPLYTATEIKHQLNDSGARALVVLANIAKNSASIIQETQVEQVIVTEIADLHSPLKKNLINFLVKYVKKMVPDFSFPNQIKLSKALGSGKETFSPPSIKPDDIAVLQYTGGTTGVAKGAMLTHQNLVANMTQVNEHMKTVFRKNQELYIAPLPLYHIYSFTIHCTSALSLGNHSLLIPNPRDIPAFVKMLQPVKFTFFVGLNTLFNALMRNEEFRQLDFSELRMTSSGGMALTAETSKQWGELTHSKMSEGYGLTETSPVVCINPCDGPRVGYVGVALPETELKVVDDKGKKLKIGEPGELCIRGPQVMKGYWLRPEATAEVIDKDGWFHSGDIAVIEEDGFVKIVDRKKDMINVSGFKVFPNEVEDVLAGHPEIIEAAVIGVPDGDGSEIVKAFVVSTNPNLTVDSVRQYAKTKLTAYKVPHLVEVCKDLPKSNIGKVLRRELRDRELAKAETETADS